MPSSEEIVRKFREMPDRHDFLSNTYLDDPREAAERFWRSEEFVAVHSWVVNSGCIFGRVLDLGAGPGIASYAWARSGYNVIACDPDASEVVGLNAARSITEATGVPISLCVGTGESLPFSPESFDVVYVRQTLHHAGDPERLCREVCRVLRSGGVFALTREHVVNTPEGLEAFRQEHPLHWFTQNENAYPRARYIELLNKAGLRVIKVLGPHDTVVNYFPMSTEDFRVRFRTALSLRVGRRFASLLSRSLFLRGLYGRYLSMTDRTPGRLFSFIALKP